MADKTHKELEQAEQNNSSLASIAESLDTIASCLLYFVNKDKEAHPTPTTPEANNG